ncbi:MAG: helix-turn-helix domain-containing protein [Planctomycetota bacterium]
MDSIQEEPGILIAPSTYRRVTRRTKKLHQDKSLEIDDICKTLRISRSTFYRYMRL